LLDGISGTLAAKVGALGQRHPPQAVRDVVFALCQVRAWRADELSTVLRRNPEVVRQNYLRPLMREGRLTMTHPQEPNDPQQAYRAVADR
jgi:ATP-dependent DNA helicase RecG